MENRRSNIKQHVVLAASVLLLLGLWIGYVRGDIGMSERAMREDHRDYVKDGCTVREDIGDTMAAFLDYNAEADDYDLDIYVKRKNDIGWFFRFGGASGALDYLMQMNCEGNEEYVLTWGLSENRQHAQTAGLFPLYCPIFPCNTPSIPAEKWLAHRKNPSPLGKFPVFR